MIRVSSFRGERKISKGFFFKKRAISHDFTNEASLCVLTKKILYKILLHMQLACSSYIDYLGRLKLILWLTSLFSGGGVK